jgi:hypothetical protein
MTTEPVTDKGALARELSRLTTERTTLFANAGTRVGLSKEQHARLGLVERQIDECFLRIRQQRAAHDARRFTNEVVGTRRAIKPGSEAGPR